MHRSFIAAAAVIAIGGCSTAQVQSDPSGATPPPPGAEDAVVPPGTEMLVELDDRLSAKDNGVGDQFTATVKQDVQRGGQVLVPSGSTVTGQVTGVDPADKVGDQAAIRLAFQSIDINGTRHAFAADVVEVDPSLTERARDRDVAEKAGVGAASGAVIGAIIGGSLKDLLIGGVLGAGAGTIISLGMGEVQSTLPAGTDLTIRTTQSVAAR
jgi:hypothetical protein